MKQQYQRAYTHNIQRARGCLNKQPQLFRKKGKQMDNKVREIIVDALFNNNFKVNYAGDLSKLTRELDDKLEIKIKV
jgi:hypothetical protein